MLSVTDANNSISRVSMVTRAVKGPFCVRTVGIIMTVVGIMAVFTRQSFRFTFSDIYIENEQIDDS